MHIFIEKLQNVSKLSRKCDIGCDSKTTVLKFASFLRVEWGGGAKQPSEVSNIYL